MVRKAAFKIKVDFSLLCFHTRWHQTHDQPQHMMDALLCLLPVVSDIVFISTFQALPGTARHAE